MSIDFYPITYESVTAQTNVQFFRDCFSVIESHLSDDARIANYITSITVSTDTSDTRTIGTLTCSDGRVFNISQPYNGSTSSGSQGSGSRFIDSITSVICCQIYSGNTKWVTDDFPNGIYVTDYGIAFTYGVNTVPMVFFTKTNANTIALVAGVTGGVDSDVLRPNLYNSIGSASAGRLWASDSTSLYSPTYVHQCGINSDLNNRPATTVLAPIPMMGSVIPNYCPNLMVMVFRQTDNTRVVVDINGTHYLVNGVFALKV